MSDEDRREYYTPLRGTYALSTFGSPQTPSLLGLASIADDPSQISGAELGYLCSWNNTYIALLRKGISGPQGRITHAPSLERSQPSG